MDQHPWIDSVLPVVDAGRFPVKRIAGEPCVVEATVFRDGHEVVRVAVQWRSENDAAASEALLRSVNPGLDLWRGEFPLERPGRYFFTVVAWTDGYASWLADFRKRVEGGQSGLTGEIAEGVALLRDVLPRSTGSEATRSLRRAVDAWTSPGISPREILDQAMALEPAMLILQDRRDLVRQDPELEVRAERERARFGAWYELFIRSQGTTPGKASTFREAERRLPRLRDLGFDVIYLAPIHPIGLTQRKGRNNVLVASPDDPGSPWAVGSPAGGHDAVEPSIGTIRDFEHFLQEAGKLGMEVALDLALQCSPDHPWVTQHPEWFYRRPDGSIRFAENPPKKYEDIYPLNFDSPDRRALWNEIRRIVLFWAGHGVRIFRVDNPHTKPLRFWRWLIGEIQAVHPDAIFLAEAFTHPPMMKALALIGFTQSYTYFTWRNTKAELVEYLTELVGMKDFFRPNFFVSTPDILPKILVDGGRPAFIQRFILAATLSPSYGVYSGFELCERESMPHHAFPDDVEYLNSEKYEIKVRDWNGPGNFNDLIARVNRIRRENPALHRLENIRFLETDNDQILLYCKSTPDRTNVILAVVNLDPFRPQVCTARIPADVTGVPPGGRFEVRDLLTDEVYTWSDSNYVRLDPAVLPAHLLLLVRRLP